MSNASVGTLRAQVAKLLKENARLQGEVTQLRAQYQAAQDDHTEFVNQVLSGAPECMDDDASAESIALDYVASLEGQGGSVTGHREDCGCWS